MNDDERAEALVLKISQIDGWWKTREEWQREASALILQALRDERRRGEQAGMERAAKIAGWYYDTGEQPICADIAKAIREQLRENVTRSRSDVTQARREGA